MVKVVELLLHSKHSEDQKNRENVVFDFKKVKQVNRKSGIPVPEVVNTLKVQRRGVAVFGQIYQRTLSVWTTETMDFLKLKWPGRTVSVGGMQGWWEGCPKSDRIMDDAQCTGSVFQRFSSQML